jgi:hypothetical protein
MPTTLRPSATSFLLLAAGVLLGLLAIALLLLPGGHAAHVDLINGATNTFQPTDGSHILAGVLWH